MDGTGARRHRTRVAATAAKRRTAGGGLIVASLGLATAAIVGLGLAGRAHGEDGNPCAAVTAFGLERFKGAEDIVKECQSVPTRRSIEDDDKSALDEAPTDDPKAEADDAYGGGKRTRSIYVYDDRVEASDVAQLGHGKLAQLRKAVRATAILTLKNEMSSVATPVVGQRIQLADFKIKQSPFGYVPLCDDEAFAKQKTGGFCTAFLVAPDVVATAGHCVKFPDVNEQDISRNKFSVIFGFEIRDGRERSEIPDEEIFEVVRIRELSRPNERGSVADYALLQLNRPVPAEVAEPLRLAGETTLRVRAGTPLGLIGHPSGLPKKVSFDGHGVATDAGNDTSFRAQLNAFHGNSGSPVLFYDEPDVVAGILVNGQTDFVADLTKPNRCVRAQIYASDQMCNGRLCSEGVTKASMIEPFVP